MLSVVCILSNIFYSVITMLLNKVKFWFYCINVLASYDIYFPFFKSRCSSCIPVKIYSKSDLRNVSAVDVYHNLKINITILYATGSVHKVLLLPQNMIASRIPCGFIYFIGYGYNT